MNRETHSFLRSLLSITVYDLQLLKKTFAFLSVTVDDLHLPEKPLAFLSITVDDLHLSGEAGNKLKSVEEEKHEKKLYTEGIFIFNLQYDFFKICDILYFFCSSLNFYDCALA